MIEKIKYHLPEVINFKQIRIRCIAVMSAITIGMITLLGCSIKTVLISDGERTYTVHTLSSSIGYVLSIAGLKSDRYNIISTASGDRTTRVSIEYTFPVFVTAGDSTQKIETASGTVADALKTAGYTLDEYDLVEPAADTALTEGMYIDYVNIDYVTQTYNEAIPYELDSIYSGSHKSGTETVVEGTEGVKLITCVSKLVNGVAVESSVTDTAVVSEAVNGKRIIGTAAVKNTTAAVTTSSDVKAISTLSPSSPIALDASGIPVNYKNHMTVRATAYTYTGHNTAMGVAPQPGYIAVNPNVIPYGTRMYIRTADGSYIYGYAVAADTGGFVKWAPNGVDLFFSTRSACTAFGVRNVEIYILD